MKWNIIKEKIQMTPLTLTLAFILDLNDLIDLEEHNNFSFIIFIWGKQLFFI